MTSILNQNLINTQFNNYLSDCDLINKYNIQSIHQIPKLDNVVLELDFQNFLNSSNVPTQDQTNLLLQTKAFLTLYTFMGFIPFIKSSKLISSSGKQRLLNLKYSLKILLNKNIDINNFLFLFFVENWQKLTFEGFQLFKNTNNKVLEQNFTLNTVIPGSCFFEIETFLSKTLLGINPKNLKFRLNFSFSNPALIKNRNNMIKNLPFFWISG